jgi:hypothetical protein
MSNAEIFTYVVLGGGVIGLAVQYGISVGQQRRETRIERQRGVEVKALLEFVRMTWSAAQKQQQPKQLKRCK